MSFWLDGCSGTIPTEGPDQVGYFFQNLNGTDPSTRWGWRDDVEPQAWRFLVESHGNTGDGVIRFAQRDDEVQEHYHESLDDDQVIGEGETKFIVSIEPSTGYVRLVPASSGEPLVTLTSR